MARIEIHLTMISKTIKKAFRDDKRYESEIKCSFVWCFGKMTITECIFYKNAIKHVHTSTVQIMTIITRPLKVIHVQCTCIVACSCTFYMTWEWQKYR